MRLINNGLSIKRKRLIKIYSSVVAVFISDPRNLENHQSLVKVFTPQGLVYLWDIAKRIS